MFALCNKTMLTFGAWNCEITKVLSRRKLPKKSRLRKELQSRRPGGFLTDGSTAGFSLLRQ